MLPLLLPIDEIRARLLAIFPDGTPNREHIVKPTTARVVFACLYVGAVEDSGRWFAPRHLYRMTDTLAKTSDEVSRLSFYKKVPAQSAEGWYADNSRESARDEGVRQGLVPLNAMVQRAGINTTASHGRYALATEFVALLHPALQGVPLEVAISNWQKKHLSAAALARVALATAIPTSGITVAHPQGGSTVLPSGDSPIIIKAVVEEFAKRFLVEPALIWISDSKKKLFANDALSQVLQIKLDASKSLPDVILVDLGPPQLRIIFVEVVASDGPVTEQRKAELLALLLASPRGYTADDAFFVTAYRDRSKGPSSRAVRQLAWGSFAWFVSEPDNILQFHGAGPKILSSLV